MQLLKNILLVGTGGMIGSILRYLVLVLTGAHTFPVATFIVNLVGSFVIGFVMGLVLHQTPAFDWRLFLATGICGGFTTFSAFSMECVVMLQQQRYILAASYIGLSLLLGIAAAFAGFAITK